MVSALDVDVSLFFEVRASLKKGDIALLLKGGVGNVQVGIESLDTNTLKCMHKGTTFLVNVRFLKWCLELGICASWIYLYGFQGESKESLNDQAKKIKNLTHLQPPIAFTPVRVERGSPMHKNPESYGFCQIWPAEAILHSLPLSLDSLSKITVYFEHEYKDGRDLLKDGEILGLEVFSWKRDWKTEVLYYRKGPQFVKICDLRDTESVTTLKGWHYDVFLMLDNIKSFNSIIKCVNELHKHVEVNDIEKFLHDMEELGFLISDKNLWLSVVPRYRQDLEGMRMMRSRVRGG
jgi:hypothetical protein